MREIATTCCYCGVGCGVLVDTDGATIRGVRGDPAHPANFGRLCTKGLSLKERSLSTRALYPELHGKRATWNDCLSFVAEKVSGTIAEHGPDAVGFYISGQLLTEDYYVFNKLAKGLIGTNNIDTNSRLCMSSAVVGYKQTLGMDAPPACYEDLEQAECVFIAGSNTAWAHPVLWQRLTAKKHLIVVDPRRTETARAADLHLAIAPGTDVALFNGMLHVILWEGWADDGYIRRHTEGFGAVREAVREFTPKATASACGVPEIDVIEAARLFARSSSTLSLYCQGLNQSSSGTAKNAALINLHLATGQIGKPGAGPFSLTGQPNAMGGREVGGMANLLSAHRDLASPEDRMEVARLWGVSSVPATPGRTAVEMFEAVRTGEIKVLWIACTNPAQSLPDQKLVREALARAELVIVQDAFRHTETAAYAGVFLPAASWGEKEGTMTNSERRVARVRAFVAPPGEARPDWEIAVDFASRLGGRRLFGYESPEEIFNEHRETTRGRDLDITGLSYALLDERGPQQWPFPQHATSGKKRLYEDGVFPTASGRARFVATPYRAVAESADARYPMRLTTGRLRDQWHGMSRTGSVASLFAHEPEPRISLHPEDLARLRLQEGELARVSSRRGELHVHVAADADLRRGVAFLPMHWGERFLGGAGSLGVNALTIGALDPSSRQPELKHCAVRIERAELPWRLVAFGRAAFEDLTPFMQTAPFASRALIGRNRPGLRLRMAFREPPSQSLIDALDRAFGLDPASAIRYDDAKRAIGRRIALDGDVIRAVRLSGDTRSETWLKEQWERGAPVGGLRRYLLVPLDTPPGLPAPRGRIVCNCFDVSASEIDAFSDLKALQDSLKCGTNCGSCLPELRRLVAA